MARVEAAHGKRSAAASEAHVGDAARELLVRGNAVDAVIAGIFMAAADAPGVLLGPVQILAGGGGLGLTAIDGRVRQPGLGAPRPRGFTPDEPVPEAAWVGVPALPVALVTALASLGTASMLRVAGPALAWARTRSPERARLLETLARRGAPAFAEDAIAGELTAAVGRAARGLVTPEDLAAVRPGIMRCDEAKLLPSGILRAPWRSETTVDGANTQIVAAADGRGMAAIACYELSVDGVPVPSLGLVAPRCAEPVLRGKARVAPGEARAAAVPIGLRSRRGLVDLVFGIAAAGGADQAFDDFAALLDELPTISECVQAVRVGRPVAVLATRDSARSLAGS